MAIGNSIQAYVTLSYTSRIYSEDPSMDFRQKEIRRSAREKNSASAYPSNTPLAPDSTVTALQARTFGTFTLIQSLVRLFAAYHISDPAFYQLGVCTYAVAFGHFMAEWWYFGTAKWGAPLAGPIIVSTGTLLWMWLQWGFYVQ